jgi:hypothetical protein
MQEMNKGATSLSASQEGQQIVSTHDSQHRGYTASSISRCAKISAEPRTQSWARPQALASEKEEPQDEQREQDNVSVLVSD